MALFNEDAQDVQRQAVGVGGPQGLKQNRGNPNRISGPVGMAIDPMTGRPIGMGGYGPPQNGGINPGGMYGGAGWGGQAPGGIFGPAMGGGMRPDTMPPPTDLPGPRFPTPGNTGPMPPPPGMQRPIDPRNAPITPPPPPNPDGWGMGGPEGGPPPIEDPHGQFPIGFPRPWLGQSGRVANPNMIGMGRDGGHPAFQPPMPQQPMGGPRNVWMGPRQPQAGGGPQGYGADPFQWRT